MKRCPSRYRCGLLGRLVGCRPRSGGGLDDHRPIGRRRPGGRVPSEPRDPGTGCRRPCWRSGPAWSPARRAGPRPRCVDSATRLARPRAGRQRRALFQEARGRGEHPARRGPVAERGRAGSVRCRARRRVTHGMKLADRLRRLDRTDDTPLPGGTPAARLNGSEAKGLIAGLNGRFWRRAERDGARGRRHRSAPGPAGGRRRAAPGCRPAPTSRPPHRHRRARPVTSLVSSDPNTQDGALPIPVLGRATAQLAGCRVLLLNWRDVRHSQAGGAELDAHEISKRRVEAGVHVTWLTARDAGRSAREEIDGIEIRRAGAAMSVYARAAVSLLRGSLHQQFDAVVDCQNGIPFFSPVFTRNTARRCRSSTTCTRTSSRDRDPRLRPRRRHRLARRRLRGRAPAHAGRARRPGPRRGDLPGVPRLGGLLHVGPLGRAARRLGALGDARVPPRRGHRPGPAARRPLRAAPRGDPAQGPFGHDDARPVLPRPPVGRRGHAAPHRRGGGEAHRRPRLAGPRRGRGPAAGLRRGRRPRGARAHQRTGPLCAAREPWVRGLSGASLVDQRGRTPATGAIDTVFSASVRGAEADYLTKLVTDLPSSRLDGVRVGTSAAGEVGFPGPSEAGDGF